MPQSAALTPEEKIFRYMEFVYTFQESLIINEDLAGFVPYSFSEKNGVSVDKEYVKLQSDSFNSLAIKVRQLMKQLINDQWVQFSKSIPNIKSFGLSGEYIDILSELEVQANTLKEDTDAMRALDMFVYQNPVAHSSGSEENILEWDSLTELERISKKKKLEPFLIEAVEIAFKLAHLVQICWMNGDIPILEKNTMGKLLLHNFYTNDRTKPWVDYYSRIKKGTYINYLIIQDENGKRFSISGSSDLVPLQDAIKLKVKFTEKDIDKIISDLQQFKLLL